MSNTYVALRTETVATATPSITFNLSGISGYTDLILVANAFTDGNDFLSLRFNSDTSSLYSYTNIYSDAPATSERGTNATFMNLWRVGSTSASTQRGVTTLHINNYSNSTTFKTCLVRQSNAQRGASPSATAGLWRSTAAITSITISANLFDGSTNIVAGSTFSLYGIANAPLTAKATGGTIHYGADGYVYHKFTGSGTFAPTVPLSADILVIAGGGGGGTSVGGGGGGGGLLGFTSQALTPVNYDVTIGSGGPAVGSNTPGNDGSPSSFGGLTAAAGGGGGGSYGGSRGGNPGGSGGGGCGWTTASNSLGGAATPSGQGFAGGNGGGPYGAGGSGGGGGAGGVGQSWVSGTVGSEGGRGSADYSNWGLITNSGVLFSGNYYFAAGGPGVYGTGGTQATGGWGAVAFGAAVSANTGQGGSGDYGYAGSSGIVIVRYAG
jgi:hypothetical protein